jgi:hypothetical protein
MGWYIDIGFDKLGKKGGFGTLLRLSGAFGDSFIFDPPYRSAGEIETDSPFGLHYSFFAVSVVFQFAIPLGNYPIGGRK